MNITNARIAGNNLRLATMRSPAVTFLDPTYVLTARSLYSLSRCPAQWKALGKDADLRVNPVTDAAWVVALTPARATQCIAVRPETYVKNVLSCPVCGSRSNALHCKKDNVNRVLTAETFKWTRNSPECDAWEEQAKAQGRTVISTQDATRIAAGVGAVKSCMAVNTNLTAATKAVWATATLADGSGNSLPVGAALAALPDEAAPDGRALYLMASTRNTAPGSADLAVKAGRWGAAGALALDIVNAATEGIRNTVRVIACNVSDSPEPAFCELTNAAIQAGRSAYQAGAAAYLAGVGQQQWPGWDRDASGVVEWRLVDPPTYNG